MPREDSNDYPSLGLRRNQTSFIENLNGTDPADYVERSRRRWIYEWSVLLVELKNFYTLQNYKLPWLSF